MSTRAERVARMRRHIDAVRSCLRRLEGDIYSAGLKLDGIEADLKQLDAPDLASDVPASKGGAA